MIRGATQNKIAEWFRLHFDWLTASISMREEGCRVALEGRIEAFYSMTGQNCIEASF